ncbi:hypothetical protein DERF_009934 [Dermatophagoides farinae]|uniref:Uncharacterized protein n=2 Tax=Dermatophagoides farinae TaxID=6954 RepID=A0A922HXD4_DERFA|nr:hypothetical protein DERF_009934 [Dermatophagoides farinae]
MITIHSIECMLSGDHQMTRLFPVPYSKSALDQSIRVVNAFRSGIDRKVPSPILRRAAAMKSLSMDAGSYGSYSNLFPSSTSTTGFGRGAITTTVTKPIHPQHQHQHHYHNQQQQQQQHPSSAAATSTNDVKPRLPKSGESTDLDGLQDDQIEALLRSETEQALEGDMMDDFDDKTDNSLATIVYTNKTQNDNIIINGNAGNQSQSQSQQVSNKNIHQISNDASNDDSHDSSFASPLSSQSHTQSIQTSKPISASTNSATAAALATDTSATSTTTKLSSSSSSSSPPPPQPTTTTPTSSSLETPV